MLETVFFDRALIAVLISVLIMAAISDIRSFRIPNVFSLILLLIYPLHVLFSPTPIDVANGLIVAGGVFACGAVFFALRWMGGGDVKLMTACALWAGADRLADFVLVMAVIGAAMALFMVSGYRFSLALTLDGNKFSRMRETLLGVTLPYGLAISAGGIFVACRLAASTY